MKTLKRAISLMLCGVLCLSLLLFGAGCGTEKAALIDFQLPEKSQLNKLETTCVAENSRYSLIWDGEENRVILYDKIKKVEWSYVPSESIDPTYDAEGYEAQNHPRLESPIIVGYYSNGTRVANETAAYAGSINTGNFEVNKITDGIEMVLYFEKISITVPVSFTLVDDGIEVSVEPEKIQEGDDYSISTITLAPLACSVANANAGKDGYYMFVPSGSGTLIYPTYTNGQGVQTIEPVYGEDPNIEKEELTTVPETIRMPVYGAVNNGKALCAIIKDGAESAYIKTMTAQSLTGYSYVNTEFRIRGYQEAINSLFTNSVVKTNLYADRFTADNICVGFYPLYDNEADYIGMANKYRDYLTETKKLSTERSTDTLLNLKIVGGITTKEFVFGIPKTAMLTTTTIKQAESMVTEISNLTGCNSMNVNLIGFGKTGNDIGQIAGGYGINKAFGDKDDLKKFAASCEKSGINLFMNFDMIRFRTSGSGINTMFNKADSATGSYTANYYHKVNFRVNENNPFYLVSRTKLAEISEKVKSTAKDMSLKGISLDTLTSMVYSDYADEQYYSRANTVEQFSNIINNIAKDDYLIAGSDANAFLAGLCDHVYDVPIRSTRYRAYTVDVPFYEIVFKGYVSMSTTSLNLATNKNDVLLKSMESGTGLTYTLISEYDTNLVSSYQNVLYGSVYYDEAIGLGVKDDLVKTVNDYKEFFDLVNGATIKDHEILAKGVNKTTFDNGIAVYVNYTDHEFATEDGALAAGGYIIVR